MHIQIIEAYLFNDLKKLFSNIDKNTLVLLDIDDTLITPKANIFRYKNNPYFNFIDDIKKNKIQIPNFTQILSHWRLARHSILVHQEWPSLIEDIKSKTTVFALTQMETGPFGQIPKMEEWRTNELQEKNIFFSELMTNANLSESSDQKLIQLIKSEQGYAAFYKGILMTGPFSKSQVLGEALKKLSKFDHIIMVDDRLDQINDIATLAKTLNINYTGIHFRGVENIEGTVNIKIAELQKKYLLEHCKWYEDHEIVLLKSD